MLAMGIVWNSRSPSSYRTLRASPVYVEVALSRTAANASAGIAGIQIGKADLCLAPSANQGSAERRGST